MLPPQFFRRSLLILGSSLLTWLTGCVAPQATFRVRSDAPVPKTIAVLPPDIEEREVSAGGVQEKRDDWQVMVGANIAGAVASVTGGTRVIHRELDAAAEKELSEADALMRAVSYNHLVYLMGPERLNSAQRPLTYHLGSLEHLADATKSEAMLFVYTEDTHATSGRKVLEVLAGVPPAAGLMTAALVGRDGTVYWFNFFFAQRIDLRSPDEARRAVGELLRGLPR